MEGTFFSVEDKITDGSPDQAVAKYGSLPGNSKRVNHWRPILVIE